MSSFVKSTNNSQVFGVQSGTIDVNSLATFNGDTRAYGTTWLNMSGKVNGVNVGGKIDQSIGNYNSQYGSITSFQYHTGVNGGNNTAMGKVNMEAMTTGYNNTACGAFCLSYDTTGYYNTCLGQYCGQSIVTGYKNTLVGATCNVASDSYHNSTCLGFGSTISANNQIMLGTMNENVVIPNTLTFGSSKPIKGYYSGSSSAPASNGVNTVSFGFTFFTTPVVVATLKYYNSATNGSLVINTISTTSFTYTILDNTNANVESHFTLNWIAMN